MIVPIPAQDTYEVGYQKQVESSSKQPVGPAASVLAKTDTKKDRLIKSTAAKNKILAEYEEKFKATSSHPIVAKKKGETTPLNSSNIPTYYDIVKSSVMKPRKNMHYRVQDLNLKHVIVVVMNQMKDWLNDSDLESLSTISKDFRRVVPRVKHLLSVDFSQLIQPRLEYESQTEVDPHRVEMATAAFVACGLDPGKFVRLMNKEYTGEGRRISSVLKNVRPHVSVEDYEHIKRILTHGCPANLEFEEPDDSKLNMMRRGNQKSFVENPDIVRKTVNKEDKFSQLIPIEEWCCLFSPYVRHTPQGMVCKINSNPRMVWDGSTKLTAMDTVMNEITSTDEEADITFGLVEKQFCRYIYNLRVTYPNSEILLATADVKACFRFPRINPDLTGAFGFLADGYYCLATSMVFGSNTSATSWEPFRRAIEALSVVFANRSDLVKKHERYLKIIQWEKSKSRREPFVKAEKCELNPGVLDEDGNEIPSPAMFYVDDALMASCGTSRMEMTLAAVIEAIFVVMGEPDTKIRQCPLAMDKWAELIVGPGQKMLGLNWETRRMSVGIPDMYINEVRAILKDTWHTGRDQFYAGEANKLVGKLARLGKGAPWVYHLMSHMYTSIAHALGENKKELKKFSPAFRSLIDTIGARNFNASKRRDHDKVVRFAIKQAARQVHHSTRKYNINKTMRAEIEFFREMLRPESSIKWETPIAFLIKRTPFAKAYGDACLTGAGGYSVPLRFWWHLEFPEDVVNRTLLHRKNNEDGQLISINVLEFVTVIINYCAALTVLKTEHVTNDPYPVLLNVTDNTAALNWTIHTCKSSMIGRLLARFFCSLLIGSRLGINSEWISTEDNEVADQISRLRKESKTNSSHHFSFDYKTLQQKYSELKHCRSFLPAPELLSMIWDLVLLGKWPNHEKVMSLKQSGLGKLSGSSGAPSKI